MLKIKKISILILPRMESPEKSFKKFLIRHFI
nr:MAG TPA: hypothetical protein [Caudoviricetes sp.]